MRCHFGCVHCLLQSHKRFNAVFASHFVKFKVLTVCTPYVIVLTSFGVQNIYNIYYKSKNNPVVLEKTILDLSESFTTAVGHLKLKGC